MSAPPYTDGENVETLVDDNGKVTVKDTDELDCGKELQLIIPKVENLTYNSVKISEDGVYPIVYKVTAIPADEYELVPSDVRVEWTVEIPEIEDCPVISDVQYLKVEANGTSEKVKTSKFTLTFSEDIKGLAVEDIKVSTKAKAVDKYELSNLVAKGKGIYDVDINGEWNNETNINVTVTKKEYQFDPDVHSTIIFNVVEDNGNGGTTPPTGPGEKPEPGKPGTVNPTNPTNPTNPINPTNPVKPLPQTGSDAMSIAMMALLSVGAIGFVAYRRIFK